MTPKFQYNNSLAVRLYSVNTDSNLSRYLDISRLQLPWHQYLVLPVGVARCVSHLSSGYHGRLGDWSRSFRNWLTDDEYRGYLGVDGCNYF